VRGVPSPCGPAPAPRSNCFGYAVAPSGARPRVGNERIHRTSSLASISVVRSPSFRAVSSLSFIARKIRVRLVPVSSAARSGVAARMANPLSIIGCPSMTNYPSIRRGRSCTNRDVKMICANARHAYQGGLRIRKVMRSKGGCASHRMEVQFFISRLGHPNGARLYIFSRRYPGPPNQIRYF